MLSEQLKKMQKEFQSENRELSIDVSPEFDTMFIIDRSVDLLTPMRTQMSYEGLVDELYGIESSTSCLNLAFIELDSAKPKVGQASSQSKTKKIMLNSKDSVFSDIRNLPFEVVGEMLNITAVKLQQQEDARLTMTTTAQLKAFAAQLGRIQASKTSLAIRTSSFKY